MNPTNLLIVLVLRDESVWITGIRFVDDISKFAIDVSWRSVTTGYLGRYIPRSFPQSLPPWIGPISTNTHPGILVSHVQPS